MQLMFCQSIILGGSTFKKPTNLTFSSVEVSCADPIGLGLPRKETFMFASSHDLTDARLILADGVLSGLGSKTVAALLKTIELQSWRQIEILALVFSLRTILKAVFEWERRHLRARDSQPL